MQERHVDIKTQDGTMDTFVTYPDGHGPFSAVILYLDAPGIREELYDYARRIGTVGYYCLVPDLYYRQGRCASISPRLTTPCANSIAPCAGP